MTEPRANRAEFLCPGEASPISRAVHRARLALFYTACRRCLDRDDTAGFSSKLVEHLAEVHDARPSPALFDDEGVSGVLVNELTAEVARRTAVAFGLLLREPPEPSRWPTVVLAGDGRRLVHRLVAAAAEGLRFAGCHVIDAGQATTGRLTFAVCRTNADGGLLVGNPGREAQRAGLRFWVGAGPLSRGVGLERLGELLCGGLDRPTRQSGSLRRESFDADYLAALAEYYRDVAPLRIVLDSHCRPLVDDLGRLTRSGECHFLHDPTATRGIAARIAEHQAHCGIMTDGNGEICQVFDERGRAVPDEQLLRLLATWHIEHPPPAQHAAPPAAVLEQTTRGEIGPVIESLGYRVVWAEPTRAQMHDAMEAQKAVFGGGPSGRFWYRRLGHVVPDALVTIGLLLDILSQNERGLSAVSEPRPF